MDILLKNLLVVCCVSVRPNALSSVYFLENNVNVSCGHTLLSEIRPHLIFNHIITIRGHVCEMQIIVSHLYRLFGRFVVSAATWKTETRTIC